MNNNSHEGENGKLADQEQEQPRYTLKDLERERLWEGPSSPNNMGAHDRAENNHRRRLRDIESYLKSTGQLEMTEEEGVNKVLDELYPKSAPRKIVEYQGKKYRLRYFPLETSRTGKTVKKWGHVWEHIDAERK